MPSPIRTEATDGMPTVWSFTDPSKDWEDNEGRWPFPTMRAAKKFADRNAALTGHHYFVVDSNDKVVHEAHPPVQRKRKVKIIKSKVN